jgi:hypothetical protein
MGAFRLFSICPRITRQGDRVVGISSWRWRLLTLGTCWRRVEIDPVSGWLTITAHYGWLVRRRRVVKFADVKNVTYGYGDMAPDQWFSFGYNSFDWFTVGLRLRDDSEFRLFNFVGEGTFVNQSSLPDWWFWEESFLDVSGTQEHESRLFAELIARLLNVKIVPPQL